MAKLDSKVWWGLKKDLQNYALGITGQTLMIADIPRSTGEIGFTSKGKTIHLANDHPLMDSMTTLEKIKFITGVFAHELMHKIDTNFPELERVCASCPTRHEAAIFMQTANLMEDIANEAQAKYYFGGFLLECLHWTIMILFREAPPLDARPTHPFSEFVTALIMYGDGGTVKGSFQHKSAKRMFYKVLPIVDKCTEERDNKKRIQLQYEVFLKSKPLWEDIVEDAKEMDKLMEELAEIMDSHGKDRSNNGDKPMELDSDEDAEDPMTEKKKRRRKITFRKASKEEMDELRKNGSKGEDDGESDIEVLYTDEEDEDDKPGKSPSGASGAPVGGEDEDDGTEGEGGSEASEGDEEGDKPRKAKSATPSGKNSKKNSKSEDEDEESDEGSGSTSKPGETPDGRESGTENGDGDDDDDTSGNKADPNTPHGMTMPITGVDGGYSAPDYEKEAAIDESEYELSDADLKRITEMIENYKTEFDQRENAKTDCYSEDLSAPTVAADYSGTRCLNKRIKCSNSAALEASYTRMVDSISDGINFLYNQMKRIINNDVAEREYRGTGRLNTKRLNCGRMTSRVFDRHIDPANKADMCIEILVDESGSMRSGDNWQCAMMCCIGLTEVLAKLHIPTKVIGFTADHDHGYDVTHHHYMHWLNTREERMNLTNISAHSNNFDGYSIRYATEMIKRRKEQHKILIIISDGAPACNYYYKKNGIIDTTDAVKQAAKKVDVIGVGIGGRDTTVWRTMYGSAFIHVKNAKDLLTNIGKEIQNIMRRW